MPKPVASKLLITTLACLTSIAQSLPLGAAGLVVAPMPSAAVRPRVVVVKKKPPARKPVVVKKSRKKPVKKSRAAKSKTKKADLTPKRPPQDELGNMSKLTLAPGVVYLRHKGRYNINMLDVDLKTADVELKPVLASESFNRLDEVRDQAQRANAIAAVNANYFKRDGTPLGTLILDGEWVAGPLYDRVAMGITENNDIFFDRPTLGGIIETSNPEVGKIWVNNTNQPRRSGSRLVLYTRRWGQQVKMAYAGTLVAVDSSGRVVDKTTQVINVPYGGFVLSDSKASPIARLNRGDSVFLEWQAKPSRWSQVENAVSGGPTLIRNGKLYVDLKDERFRKTWTSSSIHARTACGVTKDKRLILLTVEGPHTLWDVAKLLLKMGCTDAMNLDGGGSTTMVIKGNTVTRNKDAHQRRVATSLAVLPKRQQGERPHNFVPQSSDLTDLSIAPEQTLSQEANTTQAEQLCDPMLDAISLETADTGTPLSGEELSPDEVAPALKTPAPVQTPGKSKKKGMMGWFKKLVP